LFGLNAATGVPVTTIRPPFVHGPRQPFYREQFFWDRLHDGRPIILPDGGTAPLQWVFVADVAECCARALERPAAIGEAFNIAHEGTLTQRGWVELLGRVAGIVPQFVDMSRAAIHAAGGHPFMHNLYFGEFIDIPPHTTVIDKAPRLLGVAPTPIEEAFAAGYAWYRSQPRRTIDYSFEDKLLAGRR
jgi:nucleoside-diphosphate-sugar epimerase